MGPEMKKKQGPDKRGNHPFELTPVIRTTYQDLTVTLRKDLTEVDDRTLVTGCRERQTLVPALAGDFSVATDQRIRIGNLYILPPTPRCA